MSSQKDAPDIDALLKASQWEERLAEARVKREAVLAAKKATAGRKETIAKPRAPQRPRAAHAPPPRQGYLMLAALMTIAALLGAAVFWLFQDQVTALFEFLRP